MSMIEILHRFRYKHFTDNSKIYFSAYDKLIGQDLGSVMRIFGIMINRTIKRSKERV